MTRTVSQVIILTLLSGPVVPGSIIDELLTHMKPSGTSQMAASLRRQLMTNNYDYMSSETEEFLGRQDFTASEAPARSSFNGPPPPPELVNDIYVPRADDPVGFNSIAPPDGVAKNDLLHYLDDDRPKQRAEDTDRLGPNNPIDTNLMNEFESNSPKAKYSLLKVRTEGTRRSGAPIYRRFLQEEGADGVAIINLDDGTFPQFRLPRDRRQYMSGDEEVSDAVDLEVAPLADLSDQMINAFGDVI